jgi:eukaryotic-like serine/threonine-protein kinase
MDFLKPADQLGKYVVLRIADGGGTCLIYEARAPGDLKSVAAKVLHRVWAADDETCKRFLNEAHVLATLRHPNIVAALGVDVLPSGEPYMILEWVPFSLQTVLDQYKTGLEPAIVVRLAVQITRALVFLHEQSIIHRDIKAGNVLLDSDDLAMTRIRLADLGLAKIAPERRSSGGMNISTGGKARFGTWDYMAPEQWIGSKEVDPKTDVYSLGVLLFQLISGVLPFVAVDAKSLMRMHLFQEAPVDRLQGECSKALVTLVDRMLRKTIKERPSMNEVAGRLEMMVGKE